MKSDKATLDIQGFFLTKPDREYKLGVGGTVEGGERDGEMWRCSTPVTLGELELMLDDDDELNKLLRGLYGPFDPKDGIVVALERAHAYISGVLAAEKTKL